MGQQPVVQVVGVKSALKLVFDEAQAQFKAERPTGSSTITGGKHTQLDEVIYGPAPPLINSVVH